MKRNHLKLLALTLVVLAGLVPASAQTARVQAIHNSADPAAASVDVWITGIPVVGSVLVADDFAFRTATPFINAPAGINLSIVVAPDTSTSPASGIATFPIGALTAGETYIVVANGVLTPGTFTANPDGISTAFNLDVYAPGRESAASSGFVDILAHHGATDAPGVDIDVRGQVTFVNNAVFRDFQGYVPAFPGKFILDLKDSTNTTTLASYYADLSILEDSAVTAFASGFLNPGQGNDFGLYVALASGGVVALPQVQTSRVQVIHNAADPAAATVDVYITTDLTAGNDTIFLDNFNFRDATPFVDVPSNLPLTAHVALPNSTSAADAIASIPLGSLATNETYVVVANGVINPPSFTANPDAQSIGFTLFPYAPAQESSGNATEVDLLIYHGATDAPTVDVVARDVATLADDLTYGNYNAAGYVTVPAASYTVDVTTANNTATVASYTADVSSLGGGAAVVFASGFLDASQGDAFGVWVALPNGTTFPLPQLTPTGTARVQVIHNAADPAAASVDVKINSSIALDNFAFRSATPFIDLPGGVPLSIEVLDPTGTTSIQTFTYDSLQSGETYVLIANGVASPAGFTANPDGESIAFDLYPFAPGRESSGNANNVDLLIYHGATDAPTVDVVVPGGPTLADDLTYGNYNSVGYATVPAADYDVDVMDDAQTVVVAEYDADLSTLGGGAAVVFASGFLDDSQGDAFGVWVALPNGTTFPLPARQQPTGTARVQVIHNAADPLLATVDVELNGVLLGALDNFSFRDATPFVDVDGGVPLEVTFKTANGAQTIGTLTFDSLQSGVTYALVANGVANPAGFTANPDGVSIGFGLFALPGIREAGQNGANNVDLAFFHGATDAPTVDIVARGAGALADNLAYTDAFGYVSVPAAEYIVDITDSAQANTVASYIADLSGLGGGAAFVFASGFLDASQGEAFGVWVALADGTTFPLPLEPAATGTARVQVVHNAADPAAATVDVKINGATPAPLDDLGFREATPFVDLDSGLPIEIEVTSADGTTSIAVFNLDSLQAGSTYVIVANGVANPANFTSNPDGESIGFDLYIYDMGQESAATAGKTDLLVFHGATDAPTVDVVANQAVTLVDDATYGGFTGYASVDPLNYRIDITTADQSVVVASYQADLSGLANAAAVVFASGFVDNAQGEAFGVWVALPDGTTFPLPAFVGIDALQFNNELKVYPNPATDQSLLSISLDQDAQVQYELVTVTGQTVMNADLGTLTAGNQTVELNLSGLSQGTYLINVVVNGQQNFVRALVVE